MAQKRVESLRWRDRLDAALIGREIESSSNRPLLVLALQEFSLDLNRNGRTVQMDATEDLIVFRSLAGSKTEWDMMVKGDKHLTVSLYAAGAAVSNLRLGDLSGWSKDQMLEFLARLYAAGVQWQTE